MTTTVACPCKAGSVDPPRICKHASMTVKMANCFPFDTRPADEPTTSQSVINMLLAPGRRR